MYTLIPKRIYLSYTISFESLTLLTTELTGLFLKAYFGRYLLC